MDQAFSLVNAVNKRALCRSFAQLTDTLARGNFNSKSDFETLVLKERQRELMFEGKRWFDLVRYSQRNGKTDVLVNATMKKHKSGDTGIGMIENHLKKMDAIYWPYNLEETKVNLNLHQNTAFSSGEDDSYKKTTK